LKQCTCSYHCIRSSSQKALRSGRKAFDLWSTGPILLQNVGDYLVWNQCNHRIFIFADDLQINTLKFVAGHGTVIQPSTSVKQAYCANCDKSMKFSTVILYITKFIFKCGAILDLTCDDFEKSMILDN